MECTTSSEPLVCAVLSEVAAYVVLVRVAGQSLHSQGCRGRQCGGEEGRGGCPVAGCVGKSNGAIPLLSGMSGN